MPADSDLARLCIVGCGYTGRELARQALAASVAVYGLTRSKRGLAEMEKMGIPGDRLDLDAGKARLPGELSQPGAHLAYLAPPGSQSTSDPRIAALLSKLVIAPAGFVYVSTSGVYGDCRGALVDEATPVNPQTNRAHRRLAAEVMVQDWCGNNGVPWTILRAPGIYGPGRLPLARLLDGEPVLDEADANPGNRVHVYDLAAAILRCLQVGSRNSIYNVSDGDHRTTTAFLRCVAELAGLPSPVTLTGRKAEAAMNPRRLSFVSESRRLDSRRIRLELGFELKYADPEEGIRASLPSKPP